MSTDRPIVHIGSAVLGLWAAFGTSVVAAYEPRMNYILQCMGCHTPDGSGVGERVPSIRETLPAFIETAEGRRFLVQVPGSSQSTLTNAELAELFNWMIQTLSAEPPRRFTKYTEAEVAEYRSKTLVEVRAVRERLLRENQERSKTGETKKNSDRGL